MGKNIFKKNWNQKFRKFYLLLLQHIEWLSTSQRTNPVLLTLASRGFPWLTEALHYSPFPVPLHQLSSFNKLAYPSFSLRHPLLFLPRIFVHILLSVWNVLLLVPFLMDCPDFSGSDQIPSPHKFSSAHRSVKWLAFLLTSVAPYIWKTNHIRLCGIFYAVIHYSRNLLLLYYF